MPKTTEVTVKIDKAQVEKWANDRISELESELSKAEKREQRVKKSLKEAEGKILCAERIISWAEDFARNVALETDLWMEFDRA
jgi:hypothetical protein